MVGKGGRSFDDDFAEVSSPWLLVVVPLGVPVSLKQVPEITVVFRPSPPWTATTNGGDRFLSPTPSFPPASVTAAVLGEFGFFFLPPRGFRGLGGIVRFQVEPPPTIHVNQCDDYGCSTMH